MDHPKEQKNVSKLPRIKNSNHAWRGIRVLFASGPNIWALSFCGLLAVYMGFLLDISSTEWALIVFAIGMVVVAETFNSAIEIDIDLTSPEYHPYARDTKDVSAGAVLLACFTAGIIGLIVFLPKILIML